MGRGHHLGGFFFLYICYMISVIEVYNSLRDYCNKDQKGFVTPIVFNSFAGLAQQKLFNSLFAALPEALNAKRRGMDPSRYKSLHKQIEEDLAYFVSKVSLDSLTDDSADDEAVVFEKPSDLSKIISMSTDDRASVELLYDSEKIDRILKSNLSTPTSAFPVALIGDNIEVFPIDVDDVSLTYYRQPRSKFVVSQDDVGSAGDTDTSSLPQYAAISMTGPENAQIDIAQPEGCRDFELPEHYKNELVVEMARMIGIGLRDEFLITKTAS